MMVGLPHKSFLERWISPIAGALAVALVGQMLVSIWWAKGESDKLAELERQTIAVRAEHQRMDDKLSSADMNTNQRLEALDRGGTRAMDRVIGDIARINVAADKLTERLNMIDNRLAAVEGRVLTQMQSDIKRLDEQQTKILQVLDNQYSMLNEFIRQYAHGPVPTGPFPKTQPEQDKSH